VTSPPTQVRKRYGEIEFRRSCGSSTPDAGDGSTRRVHSFFSGCCRISDPFSGLCQRIQLKKVLKGNRNSCRIITKDKRRCHATKADAVPRSISPRATNVPTLAIDACTDGGAPATVVIVEHCRHVIIVCQLFT